MTKYSKEARDKQVKDAFNWFHKTKDTSGSTRPGERPAWFYHHQPDEFVQKLEKQIPMGRMAKPDEYKAAVVFLLSEASSYMTGHNMVMDGGRSIW